MTPRPDHAEQVDDRQDHQADEQGFLRQAGAVAGVVDTQPSGGDAGAELGRFREADSTYPVDERDRPLLLGGDHPRQCLETGARPGVPHARVAGVHVPAEAVGRGRCAGRAHRLRLACGADHVVLTVHHHLHVERQIAGGRDDSALGGRCAVGRVLVQRTFGGEPRGMPGRHRAMDFAVGDEAVPHTYRHENVGRHVDLELLPAHDLDQSAKDLVVEVRVLPPLTRSIGRSHLGKGVDRALEHVRRVRGAPT